MSLSRMRDIVTHIDSDPELRLNQATEVCGMTLQIPPSRLMIGGFQQLLNLSEGVRVENGPNSNVLPVIENEL